MGSGLDAVNGTTQSVLEESLDKSTERQIKVMNENEGGSHHFQMSDGAHTSRAAKYAALLVTSYSSSRSISYSPNPSNNASECRNLELVLMEQCVASAVEGQAFTERSHPLIGVLVGSAPPDSNCAIIKSFCRIQRNISHFDIERRSSPADVIGQVNRRIRDEGSMILGYYFCVDAFSSTLSTTDNTTSSAYGVDHSRLLNAIVQTECSRPVILQVQRIWKSDGDLEASVRFDFFAASESTKQKTVLNPLNYKILDSAYLSPGILRSMIDAEFTILDEMESHRCGNSDTSVMNDLYFDSNLNMMCSNTEKRIQTLLWNANNRLDMEKLYLKRLIHGRMNQLTQAWEAHKRSRVSVVSGAASKSEENCDTLIAQLLKKDMPVALADTLRKLPISSHLSFYDRPTIAMKAPRFLQNNALLWSRGKSAHNTANEQGNRKRKNSSKVPIPFPKGPPRLILPAGSLSKSITRSTSSSSETSTNSVPNSPKDTQTNAVSNADQHVAETGTVYLKESSPSPPLIITIPTAVSSSSSK